MGGLGRPLQRFVINLFSLKEKLEVTLTSLSIVLVAHVSSMLVVGFIPVSNYFLITKTKIIRRYIGSIEATFLRC